MNLLIRLLLLVPLASLPPLSPLAAPRSPVPVKPAAVPYHADTKDAGRHPSHRLALPNVLLVIMDDVGVDQLASFGYGGAKAGGFEPPSTPTIDTIASEGVRFRNTWSMPECSPGRSALLTGRYPMRNNIFQALGPNDLANSQVSPHEVTIAKLLKQAGYLNGMFGKFHLAGPENNSAGNGTPSQLGWDRFHGWTGGLPASIDTTAGGVAAPGTYSCGFVPNQAADSSAGADFGACYFHARRGSTCTMIDGDNEFGDSPGLRCLSAGGILVPGEACATTPPPNLAFDRENAHYVSPLVINEGPRVIEAAITDHRGRGHRSTVEVNAAIDWINSQVRTNRPWMATISFSAVHTPFQPPPGELLPSGIGARLTANCADQLNQRLISDAMTEAMDTELGRLMTETGIARRDPMGKLAYDPNASNTVIIIVGDNGTFGPVFKFPFDATRAKGSAYQTGVWVPLVVAGPMVTAPDRDVDHMVNVTDVFQLIGEIADIDAKASVPRRIDSVTMLPYLLDAHAPPQRDLNFTQGGLNLQAGGRRNGPCVIGSSCSHTPVSKSVCEDNGGTWWGLGADANKVLSTDLEQCWQVNQAIYQAAPENYKDNRITMAWTRYQAMRNHSYKLVRNHTLDYDIDTDDGIDVASEELYEVDQDTPLPKLDRGGQDLLQGELTETQLGNYWLLSSAIDLLIASQVACPGDGNDDGRVDQRDLANYRLISKRWGKSSTYDFNQDGLTDGADMEIIRANLGPCPQ
jgi:hypothetical protein